MPNAPFFRGPYEDQSASRRRDPSPVSRKLNASAVAQMSADAPLAVQVQLPPMSERAWLAIVSSDDDSRDL